jgi:hypothetical protein
MRTNIGYWYRRVAACCGVLIVTASCSPPSTPTATVHASEGTSPSAVYSGSSPGAYQLVILRERWDRPDSYDAEGAWRVLSSAGLSDPAMVLTAADVRRYDWADQTILLTEGASRSMVDAFADGPVFDLEGTPFLVVLGGLRQYGGIFQLPGAVIAVGYPVIYAASTPSGVTLTIRPRDLHTSYESFPPSLKASVEIPAIHDYFERLHLLS